MNTHSNVSKKQINLLRQGADSDNLATERGRDDFTSMGSSPLCGKDPRWSKPDSTSQNLNMRGTSSFSNPFKQSMSSRKKFQFQNLLGNSSTFVSKVRHNKPSFELPPSELRSGDYTILQSMMSGERTGEQEPNQHNTFFQSSEIKSQVNQTSPSFREQVIPAPQPQIIIQPKKPPSPRKTAKLKKVEPDFAVVGFNAEALQKAKKTKSGPGTTPKSFENNGSFKVSPPLSQTSVIAEMIKQSERGTMPQTIASAGPKSSVSNTQTSSNRLAGALGPLANQQIAKRTEAYRKKLNPDLHITKSSNDQPESSQKGNLPYKFSPNNLTSASPPAADKKFKTARRVKNSKRSMDLGELKEWNQQRKYLLQEASLRSTVRDYIEGVNAPPPKGKPLSKSDQLKQAGYRGFYQKYRGFHDPEKKRQLYLAKYNQKKESAMRTSTTPARPSRSSKSPSKEASKEGDRIPTGESQEMPTHDAKELSSSSESLSQCSLLEAYYSLWESKENRNQNDAMKRRQGRCLHQTRGKVLCYCMDRYFSQDKTFAVRELKQNQPLGKLCSKNLYMRKNVGKGCEIYHGRGDFDLDSLDSKNQIDHRSKGSTDSEDEFRNGIHDWLNKDLHDEVRRAKMGVRNHVRSVSENCCRKVHYFYCPNNKSYCPVDELKTKHLFERQVKMAALNQYKEKFVNIEKQIDMRIEEEESLAHLQGYSESNQVLLQEPPTKPVTTGGDPLAIISELGDTQKRILVDTRPLSKENSKNQSEMYHTQFDEGSAKEGHEGHSELERGEDLGTQSNQVSSFQSQLLSPTDAQQKKIIFRKKIAAESSTPDRRNNSKDISDSIPKSPQSAQFSVDRTKNKESLSPNLSKANLKINSKWSRGGKKSKMPLSPMSSEGRIRDPKYSNISSVAILKKVPAKAEYQRSKMIKTLLKSHQANNVLPKYFKLGDNAIFDHHLAPTFEQDLKQKKRVGSQQSMIEFSTRAGSRFKVSATGPFSQASRITNHLMSSEMSQKQPKLSKRRGSTSLQQESQMSTEHSPGKLIVALSGLPIGRKGKVEKGDVANPTNTNYRVDFWSQIPGHQRNFPNINSTEGTRETSIQSSLHMPTKSKQGSFRGANSYFIEGDPSTAIDDSRISNARIASMLENFPINEDSKGLSIGTKDTFSKRTQPTATVVHKRTSSISRSRKGNNTSLMKASTYQMPFESQIAMSQAQQINQVADHDQLFTQKFRNKAGTRVYDMLSQIKIQRSEVEKAYNRIQKKTNPVAAILSGGSSSTKSNLGPHQSFFSKGPDQLSVKDLDAQECVSPGLLGPLPSRLVDLREKNLTVLEQGVDSDDQAVLRLKEIAKKNRIQLQTQMEIK